jgi:hypothetical protein
LRQPDLLNEPVGVIDGVHVDLVVRDHVLKASGSSGARSDLRRRRSVRSHEIRDRSAHRFGAQPIDKRARGDEADNSQADRSDSDDSTAPAGAAPIRQWSHSSTIACRPRRTRNTKERRKSRDAGERCRRRRFTKRVGGGNVSGAPCSRSGHSRRPSGRPPTKVVAIVAQLEEILQEIVDGVPVGVGHQHGGGPGTTSTRFATRPGSASASDRMRTGRGLRGSGGWCLGVTEPRAMRGFRTIGAPRFELGTSSPPD